MATTEPPQERQLRCSFCGKWQDEVSKLVAGPGVQICDECVVLAVSAVAPTDEEKARLLGAAISETEPAPLAPELDAAVRSFIDSEAATIAASAGVTSLVDELEVSTFRDGIRVDVLTKRPGVLIGRRGATVEAMRAGLGELVLRPVYLNVIPAEDVTRAELPPDV